MKTDKQIISDLLDKAGIPFNTSGMTGNSLYLGDVEMHFAGDDALLAIWSTDKEEEW